MFARSASNAAMRCRNDNGGLTFVGKGATGREAFASLTHGSLRQGQNARGLAVSLVSCCIEFRILVDFLLTLRLAAVP